MGQAYQCWWRICREINVFSRFKYHMFHVLDPFVTYLLTLPCSIKHLSSKNVQRKCNGIIVREVVGWGMTAI
jgi:hypothetical protein